MYSVEKLPAAFRFVQLFLLKKRSLKSCATKHLSLQGELIKDSLCGVGKRETWVLAKLYLLYMLVWLSLFNNVIALS
jgi:hypothetical protein